MHPSLLARVDLLCALWLALGGCKSSGRQCTSAHDCPGQCDAATQLCAPDGGALCQPPTPYLVDGRCAACRTNGDCTAPATPVCDPAKHSCGPCRSQTDCATACDQIPHSPTNGQCVPVDYVVEAGADSGTADGSRAHPYPLVSNVISAMKTTPKAQVTIRLLAGDYSDIANFDFASPTRVTLYGDGIAQTAISSSDPHDSGILKLANSNTLTVYGVTVTSAAASGFFCDTGSGGAFNVYQSRFVNNHDFGILAKGCALIADGVTVDRNSGGGIDAEADFDIENSLIVSNDGSGGNFPGGGVILAPSVNAKQLTFINNTIVNNHVGTTGPAGVSCTSRTNDIILGNSILSYNNNLREQQNETNCVTAYCATDEASFAKATDQVISLDPTVLFVDGINDFRILPTSKCARTGAVHPSGSLVAPDHDRDLNPRPLQGPIDIGAYQISN